MKNYKVWYWEDGIEKIIYEGWHFGRARMAARLHSSHIPNIETNFKY